MPDLTLTVPVYVNLDPAGPALVKSSTNQLPLGPLRVVSGDERLFSFRLHQTPEGSTWQRVGLPSGWTMVLSGKRVAGGETAYFTNSTWATVGSGSTLAYTATLDWAVSDSIWGTPSAEVVPFRMDLEIRDSTNAVRGTVQFELELSRENYGSGDTPDDPDSPFLDRAAADNIYLSYAAAQSLTSPQKTQALDNLGSTTVGKAMFALANPSAVSWVRINADNTVTALSAADTRTALGAGDLIDAGTITLANAGKLPIITALKTLGVGPSYSDAISNGTVVQRTSYGRILAGNENSLDVRLGPSDGGAQGNYALTVQDYFIQTLMGGFRTTGGTGVDALEMVAYKSISAQFKAWDTNGGTLKTADGTTVFTWGASVGATNRFAGPITFEEDVDLEGEFRAGTGNFSGTNTLTLGTSGSAVGSVGFFNATSGEVRLQPPTGALGTGTVTLPLTGTLATLDGTETLSNKSVSLLAITEGVVAIGNSGTSKTIAITAGTTQTCTLTGNCTFTMPTATAGKSFTLFLNTGAGSYTATFTGVKWSGGTAPTITTTASRLDVLAFASDGTNWYGSIVQNFTP